MARDPWKTDAIPARPPLDQGDRAAGLILVYCEGYKQMQPAYELGDGMTTLGREPDNTIPIHDHSASRYHARIGYHSGVHTVTDLGSTNGTIVNGVYVTEAPLRHADVVRVGDTIFRYVTHGLGLYRAYRIDGTRLPHLGPVQRGKAEGPLVGGFLMDAVCVAIDRVAPSMLSIVITGESGTGKELVASLIHDKSGRRGQFLAINCAAIPDTLIESELFGYRRGAFTGADRDKIGVFKAADGGTLFLDEVGDMPHEVQVKLLRALQSGEIQPLGAPQPEKVGVRVVCATHRNLDDGIESGSFRGDLFARLNEFHIHIPPLRERKEDVYALVRHFLAKHGRPDTTVPFAVMLALVQYDWPYNVRELESAVKRCLALSPSGTLEFPHLPDPVRDCLRDYGRRQADVAQDQQQSEPRGAATRTQAPALGDMVELLQRHHGNISAIARELGKERVQIHRWLKRYGLNPDDFRQP